jgi:predicted NACHT family NTPase
MGKSTLLSFLFLSIINENKGYPVIVNLRRLSESNPVLNEIKKELNLIDRELNEDVLRYLISHGVFIFLFDGFDEIVDDEKEAVVLNLSEFIKKSSANRFIITSRPDKDINSFAFSRYKINPLSFSQAKKLFDNYDQFDKKEISKNLIVELENNDNRPPRKLTSFLVYDSTK